MYEGLFDLKFVYLVKKFEGISKLIKGTEISLIVNVVNKT